MGGPEHEVDLAALPRAGRSVRAAAGRGGRSPRRSAATASSRAHRSPSAREGSQIYLMLGPAHFLNNQYTAFGRVTKGMDVVDKIKVGDRIKSIKVVQK